MPSIKVNNIDLDYLDIGSGDIVLMLHGLGSTKKDWDAQVPVFSKHFRILTLDLRGHGESTKPQKDYGVHFMTEDVKLFLDALNIKNLTLIGFSMGGAVAFDFASKYPSYLEKLVIVNSGPDFNDMGQIGEDLLNNRTQFLKDKGVESLAKEIAFNMFPEDSQLELRKDFEERCKQNDFNAYYNSFTTLMDWGLGDKIKNIKAKTLVVASDMDYTPIAFKEEYVKRLDNAKLAVIENSRHGVIIDQPEAFNKIVLNFLKNE